MAKKEGAFYHKIRLVPLRTSGEIVSIYYGGK